MSDAARPVRPGEEVDPERLQAWLAGHLPDAAASTLPVTVEQFPGGHSNLTYLIRQGDRELVLRRPPVGSAVKTAHDMGREYRVLSRLGPLYPRAPRALAACDDPA
ncbi:MAG TPA: phosphotransferase, partial [Thermoanaerobaculia bacterium]|nr:phosphotransferase [Thermoanaerobaculia bacterium]